MDYKGLTVLISKTRDGNMSYKWGERGTVLENRSKFLSGAGVSLSDCVFTSLSHGDEMIEVGKKHKGKSVECDAIVTKEVGVALFMLTGDCYPVVVYDEEANKVALIHLGYLGVGNKLVQKVVRSFSDPARLWVYIGPGVRKESYVFENPIQKDNPLWKPYLSELGQEKFSIDLPGFIVDQLKEMEVENIVDCGVDTATSGEYFSHYRSVRSGESEGRFATVAVLSDR